MDYYVNFPVTFLAGYLDDPKRTYYWAVRYQLGWWLEEQGLDLDGAMASTGIAGQMDEQECREVYRQHRGAALVGVSLAIFLSDSNDSNEADEGELMRRLMHYACASVLGAGRAATARKVNYLLLFSRMHGRVKPYKSDDELMENGDRRITAYYTRRRRVTLLGSIAGRGIVFYARPGLRGFWITAGMGRRGGARACDPSGGDTGGAQGQAAHGGGHEGVAATGAGNGA